MQILGFERKAELLYVMGLYIAQVFPGSSRSSL